MISLNLFMIWFLHFLSLLSVICRYCRQNSSSRIIAVLVYTVSTSFFLYSQTNPLLYYTRLNDRNDNYEQIRAYSHYGIV